MFLSVLIFLPSLVFSHGGGLNKDGCHNNRKTSGYHCHHAPKGSKNKPSLLNKDSIFGIPNVTDGDSMRIGNTRIRLHGIDAPEIKQTCDFNGEVWSCGRQAKRKLTDKIGNNFVMCTVRDIDKYRRLVAVCRLGSVHLNAWMVENGWAVAYRNYSDEYIKDEHKAKAARKGVWRGNFLMPWDWRRKH